MHNYIQIQNYSLTYTLSNINPSELNWIGISETNIYIAREEQNSDVDAIGCYGGALLGGERGLYLRVRQITAPIISRDYSVIMERRMKNGNGA